MKNTGELMKVLDKIIDQGLEVNMDHYRSMEDEWGDLLGCSFVSKNHCGTAGCIVGWCPVLGDGELVPTEEDFAKNNILNFTSYVGRVFCLEFSKEWYWLFDAYWPNSAEAAKVRLEYALEHGYPDLDYDGDEYPFVCKQDDNREWYIDEDLLRKLTNDE